MNQKKAHQIVKSSKGVSEISSNWKIEMKEKFVFISSDLFDSGYYVSFDFFAKKIFNKIPIEDNKLIGEYRFSSTGFITEDEYLLAQDLTKSKKIKRKDLKYGHIYLSSNGSKYIYLKNTKIKNFDVSPDFTKIRRKENPFSQFFVAKLSDNDSIMYLSLEKNIRLIEDLGKHNDLDYVEHEIFRRMTHGVDLFISNKLFKFNRLNRKEEEFYYIDFNIEASDNYKTTSIYNHDFREDKYHIVFINKFRFLRAFIEFINSDDEEFDLTEYNTDKIYQSNSYDLGDILNDEIPF